MRQTIPGRSGAVFCSEGPNVMHQPFSPAGGGGWMGMGMDGGCLYSLLDDLVW